MILSLKIQGVSKQYKGSDFYALHGIDLDKTVKKKPEPVVDSDDRPIFKGPEAYKDMSPSEREELTRQMMRDLKQWAAKSSLGS